MEKKKPAMMTKTLVRRLGTFELNYTTDNFDEFNEVIALIDSFKDRRKRK